MLTGINATIEQGYTGYDHLIDAADETAATSAVAGVQFRRAADALEAAEEAYRKSCDPRVRSALIRVSLRNAYGDIVMVK